MTRGNQRERDREKNQKKLQDRAAQKNKDKTAFKKRAVSDAEIMRAKNKAAEERAEAARQAGGASSSTKK